MKLTLFRHGIAVDRDVFIDKNLEDALRPLTPKGREKTRKVVEHLNSLIDEPDLIVCSPLLRSQQTAAVLKEQWSSARATECSELVPGAPPQAFASWLRSHASLVRSVVAVGHEPQLSTFASWLLAGETESFLDLKKSGVIVLEVESFERLEPRTAEMKWLLSPKSISAD